MEKELKVIEGEIMPIYENKKGERLINARELHKVLENKRKFADWIKQRIEQYEFAENAEFICFHKFVKANKYGNKSLKEYYVTIDMAKELCMVENNNIGKKLRKYFIEVEKRYKAIVETPQNIFDVIYYKPKAVKEISEWFNKNKEEIEYKIIYEKNTKNGKKGEIKERGFKIENVCYKVKIS